MRVDVKSKWKDYDSPSWIEDNFGSMPDDDQNGRLFWRFWSGFGGGGLIVLFIMTQNRDELLMLEVLAMTTLTLMCIWGYLRSHKIETKSLHEMFIAARLDAIAFKEPWDEVRVADLEKHISFLNDLLQEWRAEDAEKCKRSWIARWKKENLGRKKYPSLELELSFAQNLKQKIRYMRTD
jgi:hypothetical protein